MIILKTWEDCENLLISHKAPKKLIKHLFLVSSVAKEISNYISSIGIEHNQSLVVCGAGIHDIGKIFYPEELNQPGNFHEEKGKQFLLQNNIDKQIAQCCVSHANWKNTNQIEDLIVALADKLWKGQRNEELELKVIDLIAEKTNQSRWDIFSAIDLFFESLADKGLERLDQSKVF